MLFTRCPECATTFRVSDQALKKANGQVRCGRCASVFNAVAEQVATDADAAGDAGNEQTPATAVEPVDQAAASIGMSSIADVVAEAELATETDAEPLLERATNAGEDATPISAEQVDEVLATTTDTPLLATKSPWQPLAAPRPRASRWWGVAAALAVLALGVQVANHFRGALAGHPTIGPWAQQAYALVGVTVTPHWDVRQYEILDWVATAEPNTRGVGSLKISARIQNRGPQKQPYPQVQLRLKDRWEKAVGSRLFAPDEYLSRDAPHARLMAAGETARAEIEVVDPGPDAYGFELDVCIEVEAQRVTCRADKVFL